MSKYKHPLFYWSIAFVLTSICMALVFGQTPLDYKFESYSNDGDQRLNMLFHQWNLDWLLGDVPRHTNSYWNFYIYHPYKEALALSVNHLGSLPLNLILNLFEQDWLARGNLWIYLCYFLNSLSSFLCLKLLFRKMDRTRSSNYINLTLISAVISLSFAFSLNRINYLDHAQTLPSFALPFFFYFGFKSLTEHKKSYAVLAALFFTWQVYLDIHIALMAVLISVLSVPLFFVTREFGNNRAILIECSKQLIIFLAITAALTAPLIFPYLDTARNFGSREFVNGPAMKYYFIPTHYSKIFYDLFPQRTFNDTSILPHYFFVPLCLFIIYHSMKHIVIFAKQKQWKNVLIHTFSLFILAAFMDVIVHRSSLASLLHHTIPGLDSIRTPARLSILLGPLALGLACYYLLVSKTSPRLKTAILSSILILILVEAKSIRLLTWQMPRVNNLELVFEKLQGPSLFLPYSLDAYENLDLMMLAQKYKIKIGNGYSGFLPKSFFELASNGSNVSVPTLIKSLEKTYYREIVLDIRKFPPEELMALSGQKIGSFLIIQGAHYPKEFASSGTYFTLGNPVDTAIRR